MAFWILVLILSIEKKNLARIVIKIKTNKILAWLFTRYATKMGTMQLNFTKLFKQNNYL